MSVPIKASYSYFHAGNNKQDAYLEFVSGYQMRIGLHYNGWVTISGGDFMQDHMTKSIRVGGIYDSNLSYVKSIWFL